MGKKIFDMSEEDSLINSEFQLIIYMLGEELFQIFSKKYLQKVELMPLKEFEYIKLEEEIHKKLLDVLTEPQKLELGTTIDISTLKRICKQKYLLKDDLDIRRTKTLDKIAIFIGYDGFQDFLKAFKDNLLCFTLKSVQPTTEQLQQIYYVIRRYMDDEYTLYVRGHLEPEKHINQIKQLYSDMKDYEFVRILIEFRRRRISGHFIDMYQYISNYELLSTKITMLNETQAIIQTKEHWLLYWKYSGFNMGDYKESIDTTQEKMYLLEYDGKNWKFNNNRLSELVFDIEDYDFCIKADCKMHNVYANIYD